jgi:hypothetical protein
MLNGIYNAKQLEIDPAFQPSGAGEELEMSASLTLLPPNSYFAPFFFSPGINPSNYDHNELVR